MSGRRGKGSFPRLPRLGSERPGVSPLATSRSQASAQFTGKGRIVLALMQIAWRLAQILLFKGSSTQAWRAAQARGGPQVSAGCGASPQGRVDDGHAHSCLLCCLLILVFPLCSQSFHVSCGSAPQDCDLSSPKRSQMASVWGPSSISSCS